MNRLTRILLLTLSALVLLYAGLGYALARSGEENTYRSLGVFSEVLQHVQQDYVEEPNMRQVTRGAMHGFIEYLDPQSGYLSAREYEDYQARIKSHSKGDIGVVLSKRFGYLLVLTTLPDSPAQKAGLSTGDILESIAGFSTREISVRQAELLLEGDPGTVVKLTEVRHGGTESHDLEVTRAALGTPRLVTDRLEGDVAYIRVPAFTAGRAAEIRQKLVDFSAQGLHKLVLDLRDCASGSIPEGIATANLFLNTGTIATLRGQTVPAKGFTADPQKTLWTGPVTVLISSHTAGAAEVLAAALSKDRGIPAIGQRTFGSASEQKDIPLEDGGALILTTALYYDPAGKSINETGVKPSVEVSSDDADSSDTADESAGGAGGQAAPSGAPRPASDPVLKKALEILRTQGQPAAAAKAAA
ncbi:MAG TPA: S41 family peptidase [Candidatus Acidoferrales bacterium]|nr:S41 family peptidase [Candidatus Acidoferrales bacterium]